MARRIRIDRERESREDAEVQRLLRIATDARGDWSSETQVKVFAHMKDCAGCRKAYNELDLPLIDRFEGTTMVAAMQSVM